MASPQLKRLALIVGFVLLVIGIFVVTWFLFFAPIILPPQNTNGNANVNGIGTLPNVNGVSNANGVGQPFVNEPGALPQPSEVASGGLTTTTIVTSIPSLAATISGDGDSVLLYDPNTGQFMRVDPDTGERTAIVESRFPEVDTITWSPDSTKAVLEFPDDSNIIYDFAARKQYTLPKQAQDFSFAADSSEVAYEFIGANPDENYLVLSSLDGSSTRAVAKLGGNMNDVQVAWSPSDEVVALYRTGTGLDTQEIVLIGKEQENFKTIPTDGRGFTGLWTPDGSKLLYTVYSEATNWNPELHLVHAQGASIGSGDTNLNLTTFVDKCAFNGQGTQAYCAVPDILERGSGLYPEFGDDATYTFYTIDLANGLTHRIAQPVGDALERFTIGRVFLSPDERTLYFTDATTLAVRKLRLK